MFFVLILDMAQIDTLVPFSRQGRSTTSFYMHCLFETPSAYAELMATRAPMICGWLRNDLRCHDSPEP